MQPTWWSCGKLRDSTALGSTKSAVPGGPEVKAVMHIHHTYNPTILSHLVNFKPKPLVGHSSDAQRHPQKDLMSHSHQVGLKLCASYHMLSIPIWVSHANYKDRTGTSHPFWAVISLCPHSFLTS